MAEIKKSDRKMNRLESLITKIVLVGLSTAFVYGAYKACEYMVNEALIVSNNYIQNRVQQLKGK